MQSRPCVRGTCKPGHVSSVVSVMAGKSAALYCSLSTVKPVKRMFWVTPDGHRVTKTDTKARHRIHGNMLYIRHTKVTDRGTYRCIIVRLSGKLETADAPLAVSVCSEENPCKNGGRCIDVASEEERRDVRAKSSHQMDVRKYYVSRCICLYGFSGQLCQHADGWFMLLSYSGLIVLVVVIVVVLILISCCCCCTDDDDKKSPVLARRMATLLGTAKHRDPPSSASGIWRSNAGVTTIDLELDAPDDVVDVVRRPSGVTVELVDTVTLSDASLDRIASARATAIQPSPATTPVQSQSRSLSCVQPACEAPCVEQCPGTMAEVACEPAPEARCARSLERLGVTCPYQCDDVSPVVAAGECPVSTTDQMCQTEPVSSPGSLRCSLAGSLDTGTETETDFDELYSDEPDNAPTESKSAVCERKSPCFSKYAAVRRAPYVRATPCSPCRPVCKWSPTLAVSCRRVVDCRPRQRFASSCSRPLSTSPRSPCWPKVVTCQRFAGGTCSPARPSTAVPCAPCDLDRYCIKSSPLSFNPCLGRRSFRDCSSFTRPSASYRHWCGCGGDKDSRRSSSARKQSRKSSSGKIDTESKSAVCERTSPPCFWKYTAVCRTPCSPCRPWFNSVGASSSRRRSMPVDDETRENVNRKSPGKLSDSATETVNDPDARVTGKGRRGSRDSGKSQSGKNSNVKGSSLKAHYDDDEDSGGELSRKQPDSTREPTNDPNERAVVTGERKKNRRMSRKSPLTAEASGGDDYSGRVAPKSSAVVDLVEDDEAADNGRLSVCRQTSRKPSVADLACCSSSKFVACDADVDSAEQSSAARASRLSSRCCSTDENTRHGFSTERSSADDDDDDDGVADRRSVTLVPRATQTSTSRRKSRSNVGHKVSNTKARFSPSTNVLSRKQKYRKSRRQSPSASGESRLPSSSMSSATAAVDGTDHLVSPLAQCLAGNVRKSMCASCALRDDNCRRVYGPYRTVSHWPQPRPCCPRRSTPNACNPRDRFSLYGMPFYRSGYAPFRATTQHPSTQQQPSRAVVVAHDDRQDRQSYGGGAQLLPGAYNINRQASRTSAAGRARSSSSRSAVDRHMAAFIGSTPPTFSGDSGRQKAVAAPPRPPYAGYREHYVTTTSHTVRAAQNQTVNYTSNALTSRPSEDTPVGTGGAHNRNQSSATSATRSIASAVVTSAPVRLTTEPPDNTPDAHREKWEVMFDEIQRDIDEAFAKTKQILQFQ